MRELDRMAALLGATHLDYLRLLLENGTPRPWWDSHGQPYAGDKSLWDEWEAIDHAIHEGALAEDLEDPDETGRSFGPLFHGDVVREEDTPLIVHAVQVLPAFIELKTAALHWAVALDRIHEKTFVGPGPHQELEEFQELEHRLAELALKVLEV